MATPLPDLNIGNVRVGFPVVQAALSGYSDLAMRVISRRLGASYTLCEVVLDQFVIAGGKKLRRRWQIADEEHPVGGQLMGSDPAEFAAAAGDLAETGFDVIDINFGCPVKKVLGRCRGGFHLSQPDVALEIVSRVRESVPPRVPVTVKLRRGLDDTPASRDKFFTILDGAFARGIAAVTVHGRTVKQRYLGPSRWDFLREVRQHLGPDKTMLGSGDLFTPHDCLRMIAETGVDGVSVARGAIGNPWIFGQVRALAAGEPLPPPPSVFEQRQIIREHYRLAEELYGPELGGRQMRKFGIKYSRLHPESQVVRDAFVAVKRPEDWQRVLDEWYHVDLPGRHPASEIGETEDCSAAA
ncbi:MAG: tRNA-dihydrouridine synthase [Planctomycetia bacterium]|nr:tRNA-dihydrouridine synthase [Planctomycetia bacterium]